ncbi:hypothetical protein [Rhodococcus sp. OK302]|uniref:hypothetical protein n=1 Tax=Rhodococcus sp. OK302 TaxID=1882769 RepID=UPI000B942C94|nr:hypothetical protein [Rhodococcus sp. OK302]
MRSNLATARRPRSIADKAQYATTERDRRTVGATVSFIYLRPGSLIAEWVPRYGSAQTFNGD